jgi:capsular polysaccharide biosynthesis protein
MQAQRVKRTPNVSFISSRRVDSGGSPASPADPPLNRVLAALRRNARLVAAIVVLVTGVIVAISLIAPPRFEGHARLAADTSALATVDSTLVDRELASSQVLITSPAVLGAVARAFSGETAGSLATKVSARVDSKAGMVDVLATDGDARRAARIANTVASTYLASRAAAVRRSAQRARTNLQSELAAMPPADAAGPLGDALRKRITDLGVTAATAGSGMSLAEAATVPRAAYAPRPLRNGVLAAIAGLLLALIAVIARERLRGKPPDARELARGAGRPLLAVVADGHGNGAWHRRSGLVARLRARRGAGGAPDEQVAVSEAALQGSVKAALPPTSGRAVLVCGVADGQGQDRVAYVLARALNWAGHRATVLCCWEDGLATDADLEAARRGGHEYAILDMPAVNESPDLQLVSWQLDGAILVARLGRTSAAEVAVAAEYLEALDVHVMGVVATASPAVLAAQPIGSFDPASRPPARPRARRGGLRSSRAEADVPTPREAAPASSDVLPDLPIAAAGGTSLWIRPSRTP